MVFRFTPAGELITLYSFATEVSDGAGSAEGAGPISPLIQGRDGSFYGTTPFGGPDDAGTVFKLTVSTAPSTFFQGEASLGDNVQYLGFANANVFGYYAFLSDSHCLYHFDLGYEYVFDAADGNNGVYLYDLKSGGFFYTSPTFPFPYLYDFSLKSVVYYFPDPDNPGRYNTNGVRYFYNFSTGTILSK